MQRPAAGGANSLPLLDGAQAGRTEVTEGATTLTRRAKTRISFDIGAAMNAGVFITSH